ncbi:MAG: VWA domain-containing protein [Candidatus Acidiferrales bacterium]
MFLALSLFSLPIAVQADVNQQGTAPLALNKEKSAATISVTSEMVVLHATVRDREGRFVSGLQKQDFRVYEDNQLQRIELFQHEDVPIAVGLVVDNSGSMQRKQSDVAAAALAFVRSSNPVDEMFVVNFNENVTFGLPDTELFSAKPSELSAALMGVPARGETALYDAIETALTHLQKASRDKKGLIVISDGGDNASKHTLKQVLQTAGRSDVTIYTIGLFDEYDTDRNPRVLKQIACATGGEAFIPEQTSAVVKICKGIAEDIRNQYTIGYAPTNETLDGSYRTIKVTATGPHGAKLLVRTRAGYIASPERKTTAAGSQGGVR